MSKPLEKISRSSIKTVTMAIIQRQGRKCKLCGKLLDITSTGRSSDYVLDHCHTTGEVRAVLHRSCNAAEGKVAHASGAWGAKSMKQEDIVKFLRQLVAYYDWVETSSTGMMYPSHKTVEERKEAQRIKNNKAAAQRRAKAKVAVSASK